MREEMAVLCDDRWVPGFPVVVLPDSDPTDPYARQAWVEVSADGVPLTLLLDSGTPRSALPSVEPFASRTTRVVPGGRGIFGAIAAQALVTTDEVVLGEIVVRDLIVQLQPVGWPHPGLLGMDVLGRYRCDFDLGRGRIEVEPPASKTDSHGFTQVRGSTPRVDIFWGTTSSKAVWDTGAGVTLVDRAWALRHPELVSIGSETGIGTDVTGARSGHLWGRLAACRIGAVDFGEQVCAVLDLSSLNATLEVTIEVVLGLPFIGQARWLMDFPAHRWAVSR